MNSIRDLLGNHVIIKWSEADRHTTEGLRNSKEFPTETL